MDPVQRLPDGAPTICGPVSQRLMAEGLKTSRGACHHMHQMPYGYNRTKDDSLNLLKEGFGSCTTKHMAVGLLARELRLPVDKGIGFYPVTDRLVTGADRICREYNLTANQANSLAPGRHRRVSLTSPHF